MSILGLGRQLRPDELEQTRDAEKHTHVKNVEADGLLHRALLAEIEKIVEHENPLAIAMCESGFK